MIVAVVMVLQRLQGCSDREAVERFQFDLRWKYAAGGLGFDYPGSCTRCWSTCAPGFTRPSGRSGSSRSRRCGEAGGAGRPPRVLDSTPIYDAVATMDTVTLVRSAIRGLLAVCDGELEAQLRGLLGSR